jgi:hypothetical protein
MGRIALALGLVAAMAFAPTAEAKSKRHCLRKGDTVIESTRDAVVVRHITYAYGLESGYDEYGCLRSKGKRVLLDSTSDEDSVNSGGSGPTILKGKFAAGTYTNRVVDGSCSAGANVVSLVSGHEKGRADYDGNEPVCPRISQFLLSPRGVAGYTLQRGDGPPVLVGKIDRNRSNDLDQSGADAGSLAIAETAGQTLLTWVRNGITHSHHLYW